MGFLDKLKLSHKDTDSMMPPPPPAPALPAAKEENTASKGQLPPLPSKEGKGDAMPPPPSAMPDFGLPPMPTMTPTSNQAPVLPDMSKAEKTAPQQKSSASKPELTIQDVQDKAKDVSLPPPSPKPSGNTRQQMRQAFSDIPAINVSSEKEGLLTQDHVKDFDVDKFVLPGEEKHNVFAKTPSAKTQPEQHISPPITKAPVASSGPLYIDVKTYEDVQAAIKELKSHLKDVGGDLGSIIKLTRQEDTEFSKIVTKLEELQDRIIRIDEDLFEKK